MNAEPRDPTSLERNRDGEDGLIDVESEHPNAFHDEDLRFLERCASRAAPMFTS